MRTSKTVSGKLLALMATTFALCLFVNPANATNYKSIHSSSVRTVSATYDGDHGMLGEDMVGSFAVWLCYILLQAAPGKAVAKPLDGPSEHAREKACRQKLLAYTRRRDHPTTN